RLGYGPFNVGETDTLVGRDGKPLVQDERTRLLEDEISPDGYGNIVSNDVIVEEP
ncbi:6450_t:CDS:1, partial [Acaulospora colombiana]